MHNKWMGKWMGILEETDKEHFMLLALEQVHQDVKDCNWSSLHDLLMNLPENYLMQYVTFERPEYMEGH